MGDGSKTGGFLGGLLGLLQQWQVVVAAIAAVTALWFGFDDQRRKQLELNRTAVGAAKQSRDADFLTDPHSTLAEFRTTYPEYAYCAALGYFVAEAGRRSSSRQDGDGGGEGLRVKAINDAIAAQMERLGEKAGITLDDLDARVEAAAGSGAPGTEHCPALRIPVTWRARAGMWQDCRLLLETYAQAQCQVRAAEKRVSDVARVVETEAAIPPAPADVADAPAIVPPTETPPVATPGDAPAAPDYAVSAAPPAACGAAPPRVFLQFVVEADRARVEALRRTLSDAGWTAPGVELVPGTLSRGDVRYYWDENAACAAALAAILGALAPAAGPFATISLVGRYRNLPRNQLEVWLPALSSG